MPLQRDCCVNRNLSDKPVMGSQCYRIVNAHLHIYSLFVMRLAVVHGLFVTSLVSLLMNTILTFITYFPLTYSCLIAVCSAVLICYVMYTCSARLECWRCEFMIFRGSWKTENNSSDRINGNHGAGGLYSAFSDMAGELFKYVRSSSSNLHHLPGWICVCVCVFVCLFFFGGGGEEQKGWIVSKWNKCLSAERY